MPEDDDSYASDSESEKDIDEVSFGPSAPSPSAIGDRVGTALSLNDDESVDVPVLAKSSALTIPPGLVVVPRARLYQQIAAANDLQASKVNALMKSINALQKENLRLKKRGAEHRRSDQFKQLQAELGRQDGIIEALRKRIGAGKAQELVRHMGGANEQPLSSCTDCLRHPLPVPSTFLLPTAACARGAIGLPLRGLFGGDDGQRRCSECFMRRYGRDPSPSASCNTPRRPDSKADLQASVDARRKELKMARESQQRQNTIQKSSDAASAPGMVSAGAATSIASRSIRANTTKTAAAELASTLKQQLLRAEHLEQEHSLLEEQRASLQHFVEGQQEQHRELQQQWVPAASAALARVVAWGPDFVAVELEGQLRLKEAQIDREKTFLAQFEQRLEDSQKRMVLVALEQENAEQTLAEFRLRITKTDSETRHEALVAAERRKGEVLAAELESQQKALREINTEMIDDKKGQEAEHATRLEVAQEREQKAHHDFEEESARALCLIKSKWKLEMEARLSSIGRIQDSVAIVANEFEVACHRARLEKNELLSLSAATKEQSEALKRTKARFTGDASSDTSRTIPVQDDLKGKLEKTEAQAKLDMIEEELSHFNVGMEERERRFEMNRQELSLKAEADKKKMRCLTEESTELLAKLKKVRTSACRKQAIVRNEAARLWEACGGYEAEQEMDEECAIARSAVAEFVDAENIVMALSEQPVPELMPVPPLLRVQTSPKEMSEKPLESLSRLKAQLTTMHAAHVGVVARFAAATGSKPNITSMARTFCRQDIEEQRESLEIKRQSVSALEYLHSELEEDLSELLRSLQDKQGQLEGISCERCRYASVRLDPLLR